MTKLTLPKKESLVLTNIEDPLDFYYKPVIGKIYKKRLEDMLSLMEDHSFDKLLEVGYGCGIFFHSLKNKAKKIYGIDIHKKAAEVERLLRNEHIFAYLFSGSLLEMPFEGMTFDGVVCISTLEHIKNLQLAISELNRITKKNGYVFVGVPVKNKLSDTFFHLMGYDSNKIHPSSHQDVLSAISKKFVIEKVLHYPKHIPLDLSFYVSIKARKV